MSTDDRIPGILYDENDQLGKSVRSVVYSGLYRRQMVAIKKAEKRKGNHLDQELLQQLRQLKHANVLQVFHVDATDSFWFIVLEPCDATLKDYCQDSDRFLGVLPSPIVALNQMASGVEHIHGKGLVHDDLKPTNVLIQLTSSTLKISDFGIFKSDSEGDASAQFAAPESYEAADRISASSGDIFSLGCVFYYFLTWGKHLFGSVQDLVYFKVDYSGLPNHAATPIIRRMTQQDPSDRPGAGEVVTQLVQLSFASGTPNAAASGVGLTNMDFSSITLGRAAKVAAASSGLKIPANIAQKIPELKELVRDREQKLEAVEKVMKCYRKVLEELFQERERLQDKQRACEVELTIVEQSIQEKHSTKKTLTDELEEVGRLIQAADEAEVESDESVANHQTNRVSQQRINDDLALIASEINELEERKANVEKRLCKLREKEQTTFRSLSEIGNEEDDLEELEKAKKNLQKHKKKLEAFESLITD